MSTNFPTLAESNKIGVKSLCCKKVPHYEGLFFYYYSNKKVVSIKRNNIDDLWKLLLIYFKLKHCKQKFFCANVAPKDAGSFEQNFN